MPVVLALLLLGSWSSATRTGPTLLGVRRPGPVRHHCTDSVRIWFAEDSIADRLVEFFGSAEHSLDYCCYNSSRPDVVQALLDCNDRGVRIRVVTDDLRLDDAWVSDLRQEGIAVWSDSVGPNPSNYMHNKFAVRDLSDSDSTNDRLWVASYNPNAGELRADCALEIPHTGICRAYRTEFEQMWGGAGTRPAPESARFHTAKTDRLASHHFELGPIRVEVYFGPQDRVVDTVAARARRTSEHLMFGVLSFTHDGLGDAMVELRQRGTWVGGVIDRSGVLGQGSEFEKLVQAGIPVYPDSVRFGEGILHEKLMVIDSILTIAGSANWSNSANEWSDENLIVLSDRRIAARFLAELHKRFVEATPGVEEGRQPAARSPRLSATVRLSAHVASPRLLDACGRSVAGPGLAPGVHFLRPGSASLVLVR